jgi:HEPN domain-containing protein
MTNEDKFEYWLDIAQYDLESADAMFSTGRWLYVIFMCEQSIEKLVKGLFTLYLPDEIPKIHDISSLFLRFSDKLAVPVEESTLRLFSHLSSFYLNSRYTEYTEKLSTTVDRQRAGTTLKKQRRYSHGC